jgi:tripeptide aminopeptidase
MTKKAGITQVLNSNGILNKRPEIKHGKIRVGFTDEEIGRGAHFDVEKIWAAWYTMDGSQVELEYENFNAAVDQNFQKEKRSVHPGYAKGEK